MGLQIERTEFLGWREAYRVRLGETVMVVVTEIGPRILSLSQRGFLSGQSQRSPDKTCLED